MPTPTDEKLYERVKKDIYTKYPKHSAYRSGLLVKEYKKKFAEKFPNKEPYKGSKPKGGLTRWFEEEWRTETGDTEYKSKSSVFRPTKRITKDTPTTFNELSDRDIEKAKQEKRKTGRVKKFGK